MEHSDHGRKQMKNDVIKRNCKLSTAIMIIFMVVVVAVFFYTGYLSNQSIKSNIVIVGEMSEKMSGEEISKHLNTLFDSEFKEDNYQKGVIALKEAGYPNTYTYFLRKQLFAGSFLLVLVLCLSMGCLYFVIRKQNKKYMDIRGEVKELKEKNRRDKDKFEEDRTKMATYMENISHQLKTPLAIIQTTCERLSYLDTNISKSMNICQQQTKKMTDMIIDLLRSGKFDCNRQKMKFENTKAGDIIETVVNNLDTMLCAKNLQVQFDGEDNIRWFCDIFWMEEVIGNLLKNCIEHSKNGVISISYKAKERMNYICIKDCGIGFLHGNEKKIFERYSSIDRTNKEGSGLGLSIAKQIIEKHFGTIDAKNNELSGVEFQIVFPQLDDDNIYKSHICKNEVIS